MNSSQRIEPKLYFFHNVSAPGTFLVTRNFSQLFALCAILMLCFFSGIVFNALRTGNTKKSAVKRSTLKLLLGNLASTIIACIWCVSMTVFDHVDPMVCKYHGRFGGSLYITTNFFAYLLLLKRAAAVQGTSAIGGSRFSKLVYRVVIVLVKMGTATMPLIAVVAVFLFHGRVYFDEEYCVEHVDATIAWVTLCVDNTLSFGYLMLFLLPVLDHMRMMESLSVNPLPASKLGFKFSKMQAGTGGSASKTARIKATAIRNLKISSVAILSTFIFVGGVGMASELTSGEDVALLPYLHMLNWDVYAATIDMCVNSVCLMLMTRGLWSTESRRSVSTTKGKGVKAVYATSGGSGDRASTENVVCSSREPLFPDSES